MLAKSFSGQQEKRSNLAECAYEGTWHGDVGVYPGCNNSNDSDANYN